MESKDVYSFISLKLSSHKTPVFKEEKNKDWIIYGAEKGDYYNNYPKYLNYLFNRSSKHNAFINGKANYIFGKGLDYDRTALTIEQQAHIDSILLQKNSNGDTLNDVLKKAVLDKKLYGGYYYEIVWNKAGNKFDIFHMPYNSLRKDKDGDGFWFSKDWAAKEQSEEKTGLKFIPKFDEENTKGSFIWAYKEYRPDITDYALPDYVGSIVYAEIDVELSNYRINAIKSGFNAGTIISFNNGKPTLEEKEVIERKLKEKFEGTDRANSLLINFSSSKDSAPSIEHLSPQNVDESLENLNKDVIQELIIGHRISNPILVGLKTEGQLGGRTEVADSFELMNNTYIKPNQQEIENDLNYLLRFNNFPTELFLKELEPITEQVPFEKKWEVMTADEKREKVGLEPIEEDVKPVVSSVVHRFDDECCSHNFGEHSIDDAIELFMQMGIDSKDYYVTETKDNFMAMDADQVFEHEVKNYAFDLLDGEVKILYRNILELLTKDPLMPNEVIAKALKTTPTRVKVAVERLISDGAIKEGTKVSGDEKSVKRTPTADSMKILEQQGSNVTNLAIMYSYQPRPEFKSTPLLPTSREFCVKLYNANKLYTRKQIEQMSAILGYDVWTKRGGWFNKGDGRIFPYCRHIWNQVVVRKKD